MAIPAAAAKSLQSCPTLWDPIDGSPPCSPVPGILQARTLEWVAISFSNAWKWKVKVKSLSHVRLLATPSTAARQAPPPMGFSRQERWSGCHCLLRFVSLIAYCLTHSKCSKYVWCRTEQNWSLNLPVLWSETLDVQILRQITMTNYEIYVLIGKGCTILNVSL